MWFFQKLHQGKAKALTDAGVLLGVSSTALTMRSLDSSATPRKGWLLARPRARQPGNSRPGLGCGDHRGRGFLPQPARWTVFSTRIVYNAEHPLCFPETPEGLTAACSALPRRPCATRLKICIPASLGGARGRFSVEI